MREVKFCYEISIKKNVCKLRLKTSFDFYSLRDRGHSQHSLAHVPGYPSQNERYACISTPASTRRTMYMLNTTGHVLLLWCMHESRLIAVQFNLYIYTRHLWNSFEAGRTGCRLKGLEGWRWWGRWSRIWRAFFFTRIRAMSLWCTSDDLPDPSVSTSAATCRNAEVMGSPRHRTLPAWLTDGTARPPSPSRDWSVDSPRG